ncbi:uncharacterized protein LOC141833162 [Curcuma longa]|uniref:uncharacterized protein LOC141833162 n=1 Tax=Curcuma longa TaxID=136217 RepID=UPI003D9F1042
MVAQATWDNSSSDSSDDEEELCHITRHMALMARESDHDTSSEEESSDDESSSSEDEVYILNTKDDLRKFEAKADEGILVGYSSSSKGYRVYNKRTQTIEESSNVEFDESNNTYPRKSPIDEDINARTQDITNELKNLQLESNNLGGGRGDSDDELKRANNKCEEPTRPRTLRHHQDHPIDQVVGDVEQGVRTRSHFRNQTSQIALISQFEPKTIDEALIDTDWILAMQEELNQFERSDVWELVPRPSDNTIVTTKWVFRNKLDDQGKVTRNKARLVARGFNQVEGLDYDETYAPVARLESIRILLGYAAYMGFKLHQMDVKSAFLNGFIKEEVYVEQPPGFENVDYPNHVYKLKKALYGLKQAPRAWSIKEFLNRKLELVLAGSFVG